MHGLPLGDGRRLGQRGLRRGGGWKHFFHKRLLDPNHPCGRANGDIRAEKRDRARSIGVQLRWINVTGVANGKNRRH